MEQGNQLLDQAVDANDAIRDQNLKTTQTYDSDKKTDKQIAEGEEWYHGVTDAFGAHGALQSVASTRARMADKGLSYAGLAKQDVSDLGSKFSGGTAGDLETATKDAGKTTSISESLQSGLSRAGQVGKEGIGRIRGALGSQAPVPREPQFVAGSVESSADLPPADSTPAPTTDEPPAGTTEPTTPETPGAEGTPTPEGTTPTGETTGAPTPAEGATPTPGEGAGATVTEDAGSKSGSLFERGIEFTTRGKAPVGSLANAGLGKVLGNIGGGIDVVKDFDNIGKKGGFFGGTGASTGDEISNALTIGGSVLDIASLALPFLAPIAGAVQIAGAIDGTYQAVKDSDAQASATNASYQSNLKADVVPPSLAGVGFLATAQSNPVKQIGGTGSF